MTFTAVVVEKARLLRKEMNPTRRKGERVLNIMSRYVMAG